MRVHRGHHPTLPDRGGHHLSTPSSSTRQSGVASRAVAAVRPRTPPPPDCVPEPADRRVSDDADPARAHPATRRPPRSPPARGGPHTPTITVARQIASALGTGVTRSPGRRRSAATGSLSRQPERTDRRMHHGLCDGARRGRPRRHRSVGRAAAHRHPGGTGQRLPVPRPPLSPSVAPPPRQLPLFAGPPRHFAAALGTA